MATLHYGEAEWLDFVRGLRPPARRAELAEHLRRCAACQAETRLWRAAAAVLRRPTEEPPPAARAAALAAARPPRRLERIYDSERAPLVQVMRRRAHRDWSGPRRMMFANLDLEVELRMEPSEAWDAKQRIAGVARRPLFSRGAGAGLPDPGDPMSALLVLAESRGDVLATTETDAEGEFALELARGPGLRLFFGPSGDAVLTLPR